MNNLMENKNKKFRLKGNPSEKKKISKMMALVILGPEIEAPLASHLP